MAPEQDALYFSRSFRTAHSADATPLTNVRFAVDGSVGSPAAMGRLLREKISR